jgi:uncharacterized membrane protein
MTLLFLLLIFGIIWLNLAGLAVLTNYAVGDYAVSRVGAPITLCLVFFFIEHFVGFGPQLWLLPFSTVLAGYLVWKETELVGNNLMIEAAFGLGLAYCLAWRYAFPDIDLTGERIPDLVFIQDYMGGTRLPPTDRWLPPFKLDFYYSFQHYSAALLGRWFRLDSTYSYQAAYCVITGLITAAIYGAANRLCSWRPGRWIVMLALLVGGCGLGLEANLSMNHFVIPSQIEWYLGFHYTAKERTELGQFLDSKMYASGIRPELPVSPLSSQIAVGELHPPYAGFLILTFSALLIASLESEEDRRRRNVLAGALAATIPVSLIANTWIFPLQTLLVGAWLAYRAIQGDRRPWLACLVGAGVASLLAYPFLAGFLPQSLAGTGQFRLVKPDQFNWIGWFLVFWPVLGLVLLGGFNRERRRLALFLVCLWAVLAVGTEIVYIHDYNGGAWERFNSTLKWWGWIYAGAVLTLGAVNLGSVNRICRYGSALMLLGPCAEAYNFGRFYWGTGKPSLGHVEGTFWMTHDPNYRKLVASLKAEPDGICIDSNTNGPNLTAVFAGKESLVGWPFRESLWRDFQTEIGVRGGQIDAFYGGKADDRLAWLLKNDVRYIVWMQKDNIGKNSQLMPIMTAIGSRYTWHQFYGAISDRTSPLLLGYWERNDPISHP